MSKYYLLLLACTGILSATSCGSDDDDIPLRQSLKSKIQASPRQYTYSVYLENSGSLNGYLNVTGDSNFKNNVYGLITEINDLPEKRSLNLYDINTKVIPVALQADATALSDYISHLNPKTFSERSRLKGGDQTQSDLSMVFKRILDSCGRDEVSLLISDCIFSPGRKQKATDYLEAQKHNIHGFFSEKLKSTPLSTLVLQFYSDFKGNYYYEDNSNKSGFFRERPYYVVCFGVEGALHQLLRKVQDNDNFKGFRNFLFLTDTKVYNVSPRIRSNSEYYVYDPDKPLTIEDITGNDRDHKFRITFGVDFSNLPVDERYLRNYSHYVVSDGYTIESAQRSTKEGSTHDITLVADKPRTGKVQISLLKRLPDWISASNLQSDKGLPADTLAGKTFGILYLLNGISNAYDSYTRTPDYFHFSITVKE